MGSAYRYKPGLFFVLAFSLSWIPWLVAAWFSGQGGMQGVVLMLSLLGLLGPCAAALFLIGSSGSDTLKRDFRDRLWNVRALRSDYTPALIGVPVLVVLAGMALSTLWGYSTDQFAFAVALSNTLPLVIIGILLAPIIEELGWRGYAVDALRARMGELRTSLLFGVLWSAWHLPLALIEGTYQHELATMASPLYLIHFFVAILPLAVVMNWLYYRLDRAILAAMIFHAIVNMMAMIFAAEQFAKVMVTVLYSVLALALIMATRGLAAQRPQSFLRDDGRTRS